MKSSSGQWGIAPVLLLVYVAIISKLRRVKSMRAWELMLEGAPNAAHFIAFIHPPIRIQLMRLGLRVQGSSRLFSPVVGVSVGSHTVSFWEAGVEGPSITLDSSVIESATVARVSDGYLTHPGIELKLNTADRRKRLQLNLRNAKHRNVSPEELSEVCRRFPLIPKPTRDGATP